MKIEHEFTVARPPDQVWAFFQDIPSVAQCLPGADLLGQSEDGSYDGKLAVKLGPMSASFEGKATVTPDPAAMTAVIEGKCNRLGHVRFRREQCRLEAFGQLDTRERLFRRKRFIFRLLRAFHAFGNLPRLRGRGTQRQSAGQQA